MLSSWVDYDEHNAGKHKEPKRGCLQCFNDGLQAACGLAFDLGRQIGELEIERDHWRAQAHEHASNEGQRPDDYAHGFVVCDGPGGYVPHEPRRDCKSPRRYFPPTLDEVLR